MGEVKKLKFDDDAVHILAEEDEATLAAIDRGIKAANEGRVVPLGEVPRTDEEVASKILFTEDALVDIKFILDYIGADNPAAADRFGVAILNHIELLQTFPRMGVPVHGRPGIRKLLHTPIRVYYRIQDDPGLIEILHFWHAARS